ncbi:MAG TPA: hypothetical protein VFA47_05145, partial [Candidatus Manganitrophaceae bacterium]|nr:hypothetical protein [Candidatus Manganitrophaceae bacterium]
QRVIEAVTDILEGRGKKGKVPLFWDGRAADRIVKILDRACRVGADDPTRPVHPASSSCL